MQARGTLACCREPCHELSCQTLRSGASAHPTADEVWADWQGRHTEHAFCYLWTAHILVILRFSQWPTDRNFIWLFWMNGQKSCSYPLKSLLPQGGQAVFGLTIKDHKMRCAAANAHLYPLEVFWQNWYKALGWAVRMSSITDICFHMSILWFCFPHMIVIRLFLFSNSTMKVLNWFPVSSWMFSIAFALEVMHCFSLSGNMAEYSGKFRFKYFISQRYSKDQV